MARLALTLREDRDGLRAGGIDDRDIRRFQPGGNVRFLQLCIEILIQLLARVCFLAQHRELHCLLIELACRRLLFVESAANLVFGLLRQLEIGLCTLDDLLQFLMDLFIHGAEFSLHFLEVAVVCAVRG